MNIAIAAGSSYLAMSYFAPGQSIMDRLKPGNTNVIAAGIAGGTYLLATRGIGFDESIVFAIVSGVIGIAGSYGVAFYRVTSMINSI